MDGGQWLTVRQFADAAGVSIQAVYQRLDKDLTSYLKTENGRKFVNSDALQFVGDSSTCKETDKQLTRDLQAALDAVPEERDQLRQDLHALEISAAVSAAERDAARQHEDEQAATIRALTESLHMAQEQCASLTAALSAAQSLHAGTLIEHRETAASVNQSDDLAKRDAIISTDDIAKRDAVTVNQADVAKHDAPTKHPERKKAHGVVNHLPTKKKAGFLAGLFQKYKKR